MYLSLGPAISHPQVQCGPGIYCSYRRGTSLSIVGRNATYGQIWYLVIMPDGKEGWALSGWVLASVDQASIPLVANVPTPPPTSIPTDTPEPPTDTPDYAPSSTGTAVLVLFDHSGPSLTLRSLPVITPKGHPVPRLFTVLLSLSLLATLLFVGWEEAGKMQVSALRARTAPGSENYGRDFPAADDAPRPPASGHDPAP
jgi:hypothetical protein